MKLFAKLVLIGLLLFIPGTVLAGQDRAPSDIYIGADEVVEGNLLAAGETVVVDGTVDGDVIVAGGLVIINGNVAGDVIAAGGQIKIFGPVQGDLRLAGGSIDIESVVGKNATIFGGDVTIGRDAVIGSSLLVFAGNLDFRGSVERNIKGAVGAARMNGSVGEDISIKVGESDQFVIGPQAWIGGDLTYYSESLAEVTSGATINGEVLHQSVKEKVAKGAKVFGLGLFVTWILLILLKLVSLWVLGLFLVWAIPKHLEKSSKALEKRFWPSFGWGLLALIVTPIVILLLIFSFIGLPIAFFLMAIYGVAILYSIILISLYLGELVLKKLTGRHWRGVSAYGSMLLGVLLFVLLTSIPGIGWLIKCFLLAVGVGGLLGFARVLIKQFR